MKLYKYRPVEGADCPLKRIEQILTTQSFWCSRVDPLNDPDEFGWSLDCTPTEDTVELLAGNLVRTLGRDPAIARERASKIVLDGRLAALARPILDSTIVTCRNSFGLSCFGSTPSNPALWREYGGNGNGVCIEVDVPDRLLGEQLHPVTYVRDKTIHIDTFLLSQEDQDSRRKLYIAMLATKRIAWWAEAEIRFISKLGDVSVHIDDSRLMRLYIGPTVSPPLRRRLEAIVASLTYSMGVERLAQGSLETASTIDG